MQKRLKRQSTIEPQMGDVRERLNGKWRSRGEDREKGAAAGVGDLEP